MTDKSVWHYRRVYLLVLDGMGVGSAPDAADFGDEGSDTLAHVLEASRQLCPNLAALGLGNLYPSGLPGMPRVEPPDAHYCRLTELSAGKDSTSGHWEMMGLVRNAPSPTFPQGFPPELLEELRAQTGRPILGNKVASGTVIIQELGQQQIEQGGIIVYTSADSVLQIAAHTDAVPLNELYAICEHARALMVGPLGVDRVIARPFTGDAAGGFRRTADRRDFSITPSAKTVLDELVAAGLDVISLGKPYDLFAGAGFTAFAHVKGQLDLMREIEEYLEDPQWRGLLFCNFNDFDTLYGHRNDPQGYGTALAQFDAWLPELLSRLKDDELLLITGDHGNDPTTASTDHSREQVPLLIYDSQSTAAGRSLSPPPGFTHVGATVAAALAVASSLPGENLLRNN